jgi:hypothetical protein
MGMNEATLLFRSPYRADLVPGARGQVTVPIWYQGQRTSVVVTVGLLRVEMVQGGLCACWCTVLEDAARIHFLNQVLK